MRIRVRFSGGEKQANLHVQIDREAESLDKQPFKERFGETGFEQSRGWHFGELFHTDAKQHRFGEHSNKEYSLGLKFKVNFGYL